MDDEQVSASAGDSLAVGQISIAQLLASHPDLVADLRSIECSDAVSLYAGLLSVPELQTRCSRLEALVHLAVRFAEGDCPQAVDTANAAFVELGKGICGAFEDPPEDAFSTLVTSSRGNHRIIEGTWESAAFFLQRAVNVVERLPTEERWEQISESVFALLALSDAVCERSGLGRTTFATDAPWECLSHDKVGDVRSRVVFTPEDLDTLDIGMNEVEPFIFKPGLGKIIPSVSLQHSPLLDHPLLRFGDRIVVALPTAVSVAIRRFIFGGLINAGYRTQIVAELEKEYRCLFQRRPLLGVGHRRPIFFRDEGESRIAEYGSDIEPGRFVQFILVLDSLRGFEKDGFSGTASYEPREGFISERIAAFRQHAEHSGTVKEGVTIVISCGIGRTSFGLAPELSPAAAGDWDTVFLSAPDAETLTLLDVTLQTVLRVCLAERTLARQGVEVFNLNGFPNLLAWVQSLDGHLVDHGSMPDEIWTAPLQLMLPTDAILDLRKKRAAKVDRHMAWLPDGRIVQIRRASDSLFEDDAARPLYIDEEWHDEYGFRLVYRGRQLDCWCEVRPRGYDRWKMLCTWLPRIGETLSEQASEHSRAPLVFRVNFDAIAPEDQAPEIVTSEAIAESIVVEVDGKNRCIAVHIGEAFEHGLAQPENTSESVLVRRMVEGALSLTCGRVDAETVRNVHHAIVRNADARDSHRFHARHFRDFVRASIGDPPTTVDSIDDATNRLGLGWRFRSRAEGPKIEGKNDCTAFLNDVVRGVEDQLCSELSRFDRRQTVLLALANHEAAMVNQQRWRSTARANLALRSDRAAALQTILTNEFENNAALLASRVLVEFAVCECPVAGGITPGKTDLARLMSKLLLAIHYGGWSDAIFFDAMEPSLRITPLGDIHGNVEFLTSVAEPFGRMSGEAIVGGEVDQYSRNFQEVRSTPTIQDTFDTRFIAAWEAETGLSIDGCRYFADLLEDVGIAVHQAVFPMRRSELRARLERDLPEWEAILTSLIIQPRPAWREVPECFSAKDIWPWRFRRQLSLIRRPIVQITVDPDPELVVAPGLVRDALTHTVACYHDGSFSHDRVVSPEMCSWFGTVAKQRGHAFTELVADCVRRIGWEAQSDVPVRRILKGRRNDRFGDIDVLSWSADRGRVLLLECKDLHFHKTIGELAEQVQDFRGGVKGRKRDYMRKHIDRSKAIRTNLEALRKYLNWQGELSIESWVVFRHPVPVLLSWTNGDFGVQVTTYDQLPAILSG